MNETLLIAQAAATLGGAYEQGEIYNVYIDEKGKAQVQMSAETLKKHFPNAQLKHKGDYKDGRPIIWREAELMGVTFFNLRFESDLTDEELNSIGLERF